MSISLLEIYNKVASQPWSMFDNDAIETDDFDASLLSSINKALVEIWCSYPFEFRNKSQIIITHNMSNKYTLPNGTILQKNTPDGIDYEVILDGNRLDFIEDFKELPIIYGKPTSFYIKNNSMCFYPIPDQMYKIVIDYSTFALGKDKDNNVIYALREASDSIDIPKKYEQLFLNAVTSKSMMYALASPTDENYAGYAIQFEKAYKLLIKAVGGRQKNRKIVF